jgi:hypothetical protein
MAVLFLTITALSIAVVVLVFLGRMILIHLSVKSVDSDLLLGLGSDALVDLRVGSRDAFGRLTLAEGDGVGMGGQGTERTNQPRQPVDFYHFIFEALDEGQTAASAFSFGFVLHNDYKLLSVTNSSINANSNR